MGGDGEVHDAATLMRQEYQHEQEAAGRGRHDEEVGSDDLADVIERNVRQVCDGGRRRRGMYFATVA